MRVSDSRGLLFLLLALATEATALPIGFRTNQGPLEYSETKSDHFTVYHDKRTPEEGRAALNALEAARPYLESWFQRQRTSPLPVVMSAVSENASFANFVFDSLELQTLGLGTKELAWHEYTHSTMYRTLDNFFGPAGNIVHLPWMPAWFLEGLAESTSMSVGSDWTAGIERYHALTGKWPSFARLHSLYGNSSGSSDFNEGYPTAGAFASYVLRTGDANKLPAMLDDFFDYTKPWWWPWSVVPFNGFLPFDAAMENYLGMNTEDLYLKYQKDAKAHWESVSQDPFLAGDKAKKRTFAGLNSMRTSGNVLRALTRHDGDTWKAEVQFDPKTGWATGTKRTEKIERDEGYGVSELAPRTFIPETKEERSGPHVSTKLSFKKPKTKTRVVKRAGIVNEIWESPTRHGWVELQQANVRICQLPKASGKVTCPVAVRSPRWLDVIGDRSTKPASQGLTDEIWFVESEEKLPGNVYTLRRFDPETGKVGPAFLTTPARPLKVAFAGKDIWILFAEHTQRTVRRFDEAGQCQGMVTLKDHITSVHGLQDGSLILGLYAGGESYLYKYPKAKIPEKACTGYTGQMSPLQYAILHGGNMDFKTALAGASIWKKDEPLPEAAVKRIAAAPSSDKDVQPNTGTTKTTDAKWRGRSAFAFPWIGADDAMGPQFGIVSVPLIDEMQNESVRATFLYGPASHFPYQEVALISTRFTPTLTLTGYRQQTYNGRFQKIATGEVVSSYLDEKGARFEADTTFRALGGAGSFGIGIKYAHLKPYIGPEFNGHGFLAEPASTFSLFHSFGRLSWSNSIAGRVAPEAWNREFDYNQLGGSTTLGLALPFFDSKLSTGLEGSRTRGKKRRDVMEVYRPLKTYVPGSGGGYNQNSFPLGDADTGLFAPVFGDTQARAKANWTVPLVKDLERMIWILYLERLDFTAFYNYGAAWYGDEPRVGYDKLIRAHGYNVDLQLENKGVRFNLGLGIGQVVGRDYEPYVTTGFDALF